MKQFPPVVDVFNFVIQTNESFGGAQMFDNILVLSLII